MVMAAAVVLVLVARDAVMKGDFAGQSALGQKLERAIDGRVADAGVLFLHQAVQFVGGKMVAGFEECPEDGIALRRLLQADALRWRCRMSWASRTIWREMVGWSSMRFCSMGVEQQVRISSGILKMKFVFSERGGHVRHRRVGTDINCLNTESHGVLCMIGFVRCVESTLL